MQKRDYERAAKMLREEDETAQGDYAGEVSTAIELFVRFFKDDNPRFNEKRFRQALLPRCDKLTHKFSDKACTKHEGHTGKCN